MAELLAAGAAVMAGAYLLRATPAEPPGGAAPVPESEDPMAYAMGIWKPVNNNVFMGNGLSEAIVSNADPDVLDGGPTDLQQSGKSSRADVKKVSERFKALHKRNGIAQNVNSTQLFNPLRLQKYQTNGGQSPLMMAFLSDTGTMVPYDTNLNYSPYVLHGWQPIRERRNLFDYGPDGRRYEDPAVHIDTTPVALQFPPTRPAAKGAAVSGYSGMRMKRAQDIVTDKRKLLRTR